MNKDIIYIDTEDDVTAIIGKIKSAKERIIALVPPKRTGVLQSAVNLRLLSRMAKKEGKELVLISNNKALIALSALAKIPVAKNLQSKPEIAEIAALEIDEGEDIIDGSNLPVGDLVKMADKKPGDEIAKDLSSIDIDGEGQKYVAMAPIGSEGKELAKVAKPKDKVKIPNFSKFRKKLFIGIGAGILLIIFLVWAIWFAPAAKIIITAKTQAAPVSITLNLGGTAPTNVSTNTVQTITKQIQKDESVTFTPTGSKDEGAQASGSVTFSTPCSGGVYPTIPAGSQVTSSGGQVFITQADIDVSTLSGHGASCYFTGSGNVLAQANGDSYNLPAGASYTVDGYPGVSVSATAMTGGVSKIVTIVTAADVQKAETALVAQSTDSIKQQLISEFTNGETVITDSFNANRAAAVSVPDVGGEVDSGSAKLTSSTTFSVTAIAKSELEAFLKSEINKQMDSSKNQRIYDDGYSKVSLSGYQSSAQGSTVNVATTGQFGPNIDK
ncbi:MAG TPA: hypothetical protein VMR16_00855, partial [Candidatus Saccharimonadales bacterium]|nr:hypothetical protein [Candidatus Saccharimonadales bacterium]